MGHEAIVYGRIVGASWHVGDRFAWPQELNRQAIAALPEDGDWPWVVRGMFALPAPWPQGTYRRQVIHFGASIKDEPGDPGVWDTWLGKFEGVLRRLHWWSAAVHLDTEFAPPRVYEWTPTEASMARLYEDPPKPVTKWVRSSREDAGPRPR